jgi:hypothetical protein
MGWPGARHPQMADHERDPDSTTDTDEALLDRASKAKLKDVSPRHHGRESEHPAGRVAARGGEGKGARRKPGKKR